MVFRHQIGEGVRLRTDDDDSDFAALAQDREIARVWLWDLGPEKPNAPTRPQPPNGKEGDPKYDLAVIEFKDQLVDYEAALRGYKQALIDYEAWQTRFGGPYAFSQHSVDARDTLERDPKRYCVMSRTRGHSHLKNQGLPDGVKPGRAHFENLERERAAGIDLENARRRDPVFGEAEVRA